MPAERRAGPILAVAARDGGMYARGGRPVWPFRNVREREALERMVTAMGNTVEIVDEASPCTLTGRDLVVGLGSRAFEDARLYAHLTQRRFHAASTREELAELFVVTSPSVIVTTIDHVDEVLLDLLYDSRDVERAPGLIFAFSEDDLRRQVLARSATLYCPPRAAVPLREVHITALAPQGRTDEPGLVHLGGRATRADVRDAVRERSNLLTLSTHSDGIDAQILADLVLCPMDRIPEDDDPASAPACRTTGYCHRRDRPIAAALQDGSLLSPSDLAADVMIFDVCWGLYPAPGVQSPAWSLSRRLLEGFQIGALITTWEIVLGGAVADLIDNVGLGMQLGKALALHLSSPDSVARGHRMCLVGDPDLALLGWSGPSESALCPPTGGVECPAETELADAGEHDLPDPSASLALLRCMIAEGKRTQSRNGRDTSTAALTAVLRYEAARLSGTSLEEEAGPSMRRAVVEYFAERYTDSGRYWLPYVASMCAESVRRPCPACHRRTIARTYALRLGGESRHRMHCPSCGPISDLPVGRELTLAVEPDGTIRLGGDLPREHWDAEIVWDTQTPSLRRSFRWAAEADGTPARRFRPPEPWPPVPLRVALIMVRGPGEIDVVGCLCRIRRVKEA